jgi:ubiquinone/menaquinone biosynthesis C-methylase UbiE
MLIEKKALFLAHVLNRVGKSGFRTENKKAHDKQTTTLFRYTCSCGNTDYLQLNGDTARCYHCDVTYPILPNGVLILSQEKTEQSAFYDNLYSAGYSHEKDRFQEDYADAFSNSSQHTLSYLNSCGFDIEKPFKNLSILDAACGSGSITAGLLLNKNIHNCDLHAFDISAYGMDMLARFSKTQQNTNRLEMSTQNAEAMVFGDATFDLVIGSSILHHFNNFENFLSDCYRILKPGGKAVFGEPFAIGYGLAAASMLMAQQQLGTRYDLIEANYNEIAYRIKSSRKALTQVVDKHIFFDSTFITLAQQIGFSSVNIVSPATREYYLDHFIEDLLHERGIVDVNLAKQANAIYRKIFDIFDADSYVHSIASFNHVVLRK